MRFALKKIGGAEMAQDLKKFEHKHGTVVLSAAGSQYIITTDQRVRVDLIFSTRSVRTNMTDALEKFNEHKRCIMGWGRCNGDDCQWR